MKVQWCWRCQKHVAMLDDTEFKRVMSFNGQEMLDEYFKVTGRRETNRSNIWHHHLSLYGPECQTCGKPLRSAEAYKCHECGSLVEEDGMFGEPEPSDDSLDG